MPLYSVYGNRLESDVEFPELALADRGPTRWRFRIDPELPAMQSPEERGAELIYGDVYARLFAHRRGLRVSIDDTGDYDISPNGSIVAAIKPGAWDDFVRNHLLGRVLAIAMFDAGWLPLHASAIETPEGVIAFLGPNSVGKSALAVALSALGATPVADDTLPVEATLPPRAWPGLPSVRVRDDVREALHLAAEGLPTHEGKTALLQPQDRLPRTPRPLAGIYLLAPNEDLSRKALVQRTPYSPALAAAAVLAHVRAAGMLGRGAVAPLLQRISPLVSVVPVHQLSITRDLSRLHEAAAHILDWYATQP